MVRGMNEGRNGGMKGNGKLKEGGAVGRNQSY